MTTYNHSSRSSPSSSFSGECINSPKPDKVVGVCKNCGHSFRIHFGNFAEFCSKDCETCFTIFYKQTSPAPSKNNRERTTNDVRLSIYEFQQQLDAQDSLSGLSGHGPDSSHSSGGRNIGNFSDFDFDGDDDDSTTAPSKRNDRSRCPPAKVLSIAEDSPTIEKKSLFGRWSRKSYLSASKAPRPQLQASF